VLNGWLQLWGCCLDRICGLFARCLCVNGYNGCGENRSEDMNHRVRYVVARFLSLCDDIGCDMWQVNHDGFLFVGLSGDGW